MCGGANSHVRWLSSKYTNNMIHIVEKNNNVAEVNKPLQLYENKIYEIKVIVVFFKQFYYSFLSFQRPYRKMSLAVVFPLEN